MILQLPGTPIMSMSRAAARADLSPNCGESWIYELQHRNDSKV